MKWYVENGIIVGKNELETIYPNANEIFGAGKHIILGKQKYEFQIDGLKFSKLLPLKVGIKFDLINDKIVAKMICFSKGDQFEIPSKDEKLIDYIIINDRWHFFDNNFGVITDFLSENKITINAPISYAQYLFSINYFSQNNIVVVDYIEKNIDFIKNNIADTEATRLNDILFPYQKTGTNWLNFMTKGECGCVLGDEMGLGKTLQVIALFDIQKNHYNKNNFLIVAPVSLLANWYREIKKFCPHLTCCIHYGAHRTGLYTVLQEYDIIITSYETAQSDLSMFNMINWDIMVVDEAQNLKNPTSKRRQNLNEIKRKVTIAVTGTPFENHISDIWSISDFVIPNYLGNLSEFSATYDDDMSSAQEIETYLSPIMLRRKVKDVANDLPEKIEIAQPIIMDDYEAQFYENERQMTYGKIALKEIRIDVIQQLRMFCTHPFVYRDDIDTFDPSRISNKYRRLCEILHNVLVKGEKALVFTSFNKMSEILCDDLASRFMVPIFSINGSTAPEKRQPIIDEFSNISDSAIMIVNPKAAGAGLNITSANHVIHYNLEWNPATEAQASARAYRRGQKKTVFIYRLYYADTIEEYINNTIEFKKSLSESAVVGNDGKIKQSVLLDILNYSPRKEN